MPKCIYASIKIIVQNYNLTLSSATHDGGNA